MSWSLKKRADVAIGRTRSFIVATILLSSVSGARASYTQFSYTATPGSWVGHGLTSFSQSPATGWAFQASASSDHTFVDLICYRTDAAPQINVGDFELRLKAPSGQTLAPGAYNGAMRYPFQAAGSPGISLIGNSRGNNVNTGYFNISEADFGPNQSLNRFAVDFQQFDEGNPNQWVKGQFLFNSSIPEPSASALVAIAGSVGLLRRHRR